MGCDEGETAIVDFSNIVTEGGWDFLNVFSDASLVTNSIGPAAHNGGVDNSGDLGQFSGNPADMSITGVAAVQYISDWSVQAAGAGFTASLNCDAPVPTCTVEDLVLDYWAGDTSGAGGFHASGHGIFGASEIITPDFGDLEIVVADPLNGCMGCDTLTGADCQPSGTFSDGSMNGKIALIQRGACYFTTKVTNAQVAGAVAAIIYNDHRPGIVNMSPAAAERRGADGWNVDVDITIPGIFIEGDHGTALNEALTANADEPVTLHCGEASYHTNPCGSPGANNLAEPGAVQVACGQTFGMPADTSTNYVNCVWTMDAPAGSSGTVTFNWLTTEGGWDFVNVFSDASLVTNSIGPAVHNGGVDNSGDLGRFSGSEDPGTITGVAAVQYITDWSFLQPGTGFSATLTC